MGITSVIQNKYQAEQFCKVIMEATERGDNMAYEHVKLKGDRVRTYTQNACIHQYLGELAEALNDAGYEQVRFITECLKEGVELPWTPESAKESLWRPVQLATTKQESTTKITTEQVQDIYLKLGRLISEKTGVNVQWPSKERFIFKSYK